MQATQGTSGSDPVLPGFAPFLRQSSVSGSSIPAEREIHIKQFFHETVCDVETWRPL